MEDQAGTPHQKLLPDKPKLNRAMPRSKRMIKLLKKSIYAGLGALSTGADAAEKLAQEVIKKADLSEEEGKKLVKKLQAQSKKAASQARKTLDAEVTKLAEAIHDTLREEKPASAKPSAKSSAKPKASGAKRKAKPAAKTRAVGAKK